MQKIKKSYLIGGIILILFLFLIFIYYGFLEKNNISKNKKTMISPPESAIIPTIDNSVKIDLISTNKGKEVILKIQNIPLNTNTIDYELSYQTQQQGFQGVIGTIDVADNLNYQKTITLGTCSSGKCVYHQVVGKIKLTLKFSGDYGEKIFEKEYSI